MADKWLRMWKTPRRQENGTEKVIIGVLAFEVASLMSKLVHLWESLGDKQIARLREEITDSVGIRNLVSEDEDFVVRLACAEMIENMGHIARAVARLGKKCRDPGLKNFEHLFDDLIRIGVDQHGWHFTGKKMEKKVKKMERLISSNANLYLEMEMLVELEQTFRRMKGNGNTDTVNLLEFQKKVAWKQQEVKNLQDISLWNRTYDYTIRLLARSLFTIFNRIKNVFDIGQMIVDKGEIREVIPSDSDSTFRSHSVSTLMQSSVRQSESSLGRYSSGPLMKSITETGPTARNIKTIHFYSGPLGSSSTKSGPLTGANRDLTFYSGPLLGKPSSKSGLLSGTNRAVKKFWRTFDRPFTPRAKKSPHPNHKLSAPALKRLTISGNSTPITNSYLRPNGTPSGFLKGNKDTNGEECNQGTILESNLSSIFSPKHRLTTPKTLGAAALALHYANVIVLIEKLVASPHLIGNDARDDLYDMLPASIRNRLRESLKPYTKSLTSSSISDTVLEGEWNRAIVAILECLGPLAHNTIRWQSERSVEQQNFGSRTNVLLVQTLHFANQEKTEAAITELLVGLNYIWRCSRDLNAKALLECAGNEVFDEFLGL